MKILRTASLGLNFTVIIKKFINVKFITCPMLWTNLPSILSDIDILFFIIA